MLEIKLSGAHKVVLVQFYGELTEGDFADLDALGKDRQSADAYDCIFDLTAVAKIGLATDFVARRGNLPQLFNNRQRIYVVPQDDLKLLVRLYAAYQASRGWRAPTIVERLEGASRCSAWEPRTSSPFDGHKTTSRASGNRMRHVALPQCRPDASNPTSPRTRMLKAR